MKIVKKANSETLAKNLSFLFVYYFQFWVDRQKSASMPRNVMNNSDNGLDVGFSVYFVRIKNTEKMINNLYL